MNKVPSILVFLLSSAATRCVPIFAIALSALAVSTALGASITNLTLKASTDKENPIDYAVGETIRFDFRLDGVTALPANAPTPFHVIWTRTGDDGLTVKGTNTISLASGYSVETSLGIPGIVRMQGTLYGSDNTVIKNGENKDVAFGGGAGVATDQMQLSTVEPADFDSFWAEAKAKLAAVPFPTDGSELTEVFPNSSVTNTYRYFAAKIPCFGPRPVTGWLTVPKNAQPGTLAVKATFDGYSVAIAQPSLPTDKPGTGTMLFHVNAHGYDMVGQDAQYYKDFITTVNSPNYTPSHGKPYSHGLGAADYDNPTNTYFYFMALRVVRAFDYLKSRPEWNGTTVIAEGLSQGGLQTMWAGSLVDGISSIRPEVTWGCDIGNSLNTTGPFLSNEWGIPNVPGAYYFDAALHAKRVPRTCVAEITRLGMGDYTCPPRGVLLSYYNMKCSVSAKLVQGSDHSTTSVPPLPNQVYVISKEAMPDEPLAPQVVATDAEGYDWTNRVVSVIGATSGEMLTLVLSTPDGTPLGTLAATADDAGSATFDIATAPGLNYVYTISQGGETIASGSFHAGSWDADGAWFLAEPDGQGGSTEVNGAWTTPPATTNATSFAIDEIAVFSLSADAFEAGRGKLVRVETIMDYAAMLEESKVAQSERLPVSIAAIAPMTNSVAGGAAKWTAYVGGEWTTLSGVIVPAPNIPYVVRFEGDFTLATPRVRFSVSIDDGATFTTLADADTGAEWLAPTDTTKRALAKVVAEGAGSIAGIRGTFANTDVAIVDGTGYVSLQEALANGGDVTLLTNTTWPTNAPVGTVAVNRGGYSILLPPDGVAIDGNSVIVSAGLCNIAGEGPLYVTFSDLSGIGIATAGRTPAQIAADLRANGANGIPKWQSYVLGLDVTDATALPFANIALGAAADTVSLSLEGVEVNASAAASVTYQVYEAKTLSDPKQDVAVGSPVPIGESAAIEMDGSGSQLFRLKIIINLD